MPLRVSIRGVPKEDGEMCPVFNPVCWWKPYELANDPRFRVVDPCYYYAAACLEAAEMRELQQRFSAGENEPWKHESDRLNRNLAQQYAERNWWIVTVYEWESGID